MDEQQKAARVAEIKERRREAREAYYNLSPVMTDPEYDALTDELARLAPDDEELQKIGADVPEISVWEKVEHKIPMGSLSKVNEKDDLLKWAAGTGAQEFLFTHKVDGSSMELVYEAGKLVRCVTRGNGKIGEDVTFNVRRAQGVLGDIPIAHEEVTVRGEIVMEKGVFEEKYSADYANPRNTAAGKVRDKKGGGADCENLRFLAYSVMSSSAPPSEKKRFKVLQKMGFDVPDYGTGSIEDAAEWHKGLAEGDREKVPYEIDGTVVRTEDIGIQEKLGDHNGRPRGQMAFKFDAAMGETNVIDVRWQVGPTGRITPVANVEPVNIGGVTVTSVSLHNLVMFRSLKLFRGCRVLVSRRNDVIPYIEANLSLLAQEMQEASEERAEEL